MKNLLAASILSADLANLEDDIHTCELAGIDWIHVDVMDGHFVPNLTMGAVIVKACRQSTSLPIDCHLMVEKPESLVRDFVEAGATTITVHPENNPNILRTLELIRGNGCQAGVALNPGTHSTVIEPLLPFIDMVLVMTVNPGFSGQSFIPQMIGKVKEVSDLIKHCERPVRLEVDGGINVGNIGSACTAGANVFVSASSIFNHPSGISTGIAVLRQALGLKKLRPKP